MAHEEMLQEYERRKENTLAQGGPAKIKRQHDKGRLTARERIDKLLDPGSFIEFGGFVTSDEPGFEDKTPADGLIVGYGLLDGRRVAVIVNDFTVLASTSARGDVIKMLNFKADVRHRGIPIIWLGESGGGRVTGIQGSKALAEWAGTDKNAQWAEFTSLREAPYVFVAMGECYGIADFQACVADFVIQIKGSAISVSGPRALGRAIGQTFTGEEMGGWQIHSQITGMTDLVAENEEDAFRLVRAIFNYMPANNKELPPRWPVPSGSEERMAKILDLLPEKRTRTYDMHKIIECIVDGGEYLELKPKWGPMLITCLARINGEVVGIMASNPIISAGATNTDALEKQTGFMVMCDSYNIPLIFLPDTPGHLTGKDAEYHRVGSRVVNQLQALYQVTVPKITVVIRKDYGQAICNWCGNWQGADFMVAWPTAELSFLDPEIAADVVYGTEPVSKAEREERVARMVADISPYPAAQVYGIQDIINPLDTRNYLIRVLQIARDSRDQGIGQHLLANWPTKF